MALTTLVSRASGAVIVFGVYGSVSSGSGSKDLVDKLTYSFYISPRDEVKGNIPRGVHS